MNLRSNSTFSPPLAVRGGTKDKWINCLLTLVSFRQKFGYAQVHVIERNQVCEGTLACGSESERSLPRILHRAVRHYAIRPPNRRQHAPSVLTSYRSRSRPL